MIWLSNTPRRRHFAFHSVTASFVVGECLDIADNRRIGATGLVDGLVDFIGRLATAYGHFPQTPLHDRLSKTTPAVTHEIVTAHQSHAPLAGGVICSGTSVCRGDVLQTSGDADESLDELSGQPKPKSEYAEVGIPLTQVAPICSMRGWWKNTLGI